MLTIKIIFWVLIFIVFYAYLGYGIVLYFIIRLKRLFSKQSEVTNSNIELPEVTLFIAAYNEKDFVDAKLENSYNLDYPKDKLKILWVTDGSDDGTPDLLRKYEDIIVLHEPARNGKISAMNRGFQYVTSPIVVFSDANTLLGKQSIREIVRLFSKPGVGCVSGEKRIFRKEKDSAAGAGEGIYWKYESKLKQWDAELYSVVGAAGELFAVRTELFQPVEPDTLLDDFIISLRIAMKGYTIQYSPEAYAMETSSSNVKEEMKRKVRIAAGGIQSVIRLYPLLNIFKYDTGNQHWLILKVTFCFSFLGSNRFLYFRIDRMVFGKQAIESESLVHSILFFYYESFNFFRIETLCNKKTISQLGKS